MRQCDIANGEVFSKSHLCGLHRLLLVPGRPSPSSTRPSLPLWPRSDLRHSALLIRWGFTTGTHGGSSSEMWGYGYQHASDSLRKAALLHHRR